MALQPCPKMPYLHRRAQWDFSLRSWLSKSPAALPHSHWVPCPAWAEGPSGQPSPALAASAATHATASCSQTIADECKCELQTACRSCPGHALPGLKLHSQAALPNFVWAACACYSCSGSFHLNNCISASLTSPCRPRLAAGLPIMP